MAASPIDFTEADVARTSPLQSMGEVAISATVYGPGGHFEKSNFMPAEVDMLVDHVIRHWDLLYGPWSHTVGAYRKEQIWRGIRHAVHSVFHQNRSIGELMHKWRDMRRLVKRKQARRLAEGERSHITFSASEQLILGNISEAAVGGVDQLDTMRRVEQQGKESYNFVNSPGSQMMSNPDLHLDDPKGCTGVCGWSLTHRNRRRGKPVNTWNSLRRRSSSSGRERSRRTHWLKCNLIGSRTALPPQAIRHSPGRIAAASHPARSPRLSRRVYTPATCLQGANPGGLPPPTCKESGPRVSRHFPLPPPAIRHSPGRIAAASHPARSPRLSRRVYTPATCLQGANPGGLPPPTCKESGPQVSRHFPARSPHRRQQPQLSPPSTSS
ncbi:myb-related transcription factor, partner of profilin-like [Rhinatrema bivittatum]|uniref:myb-related transcription factor, partner of profilin-like n=1 Tax=Rhinatrema bivittatum TaxID=194408 RepID=UPI0011277848|nr:myb-related transcription factor, partner of profilin-like [Rhinatrema bivittatum]